MAGYMKRLFRGFCMSFSMFCSVPFPFHIWDESCHNLVLLFFPVIGAFMGLLWWGIIELLLMSGIHPVLTSAAAGLVPYIAAGFLHLDGYMDTCDAVLSRRPVEEKLRILKDPHTGSFAVIMLAVLFILQFAAAFVIIEKGNYIKLLITIPVISRCCSAFSIMCLKKMEQSGYANMFGKNITARHKIFIIIILILAAALSFYLAGINGLIATAAIMAGFTAAMAYKYNNLGGVSGDLAGCALVTGELCGLIAMAVIQ